jgi:hypothetical protein
MDYTELLTRLPEADDAELGTAREDILERINALRPSVEAGTVSEEELTEIETLGEAHRQIREQVTAREQAAATRAERAGSILAEVNPDEEEEGDPQPAADPEAQPDHAAPGEEGTPPLPVAEEEEERVLVTAAARPPLGAASRARTNAVRPNRPQVAIRAAADVGGFAAGQNLTREQLGTAFTNRLQSISRSHGGTGELVHVATLAAEAPEARRLRKGDEHGNTARIEAQNPRRALTAAGGLCAPFTPDYSIDVVGSTARPVRDALAGFQADRGGIYFRPNLDASAIADTASGVWTNANDAAVGTGTPPANKPYAVMSCPSMIQAQVEAETFQLEFSNVTTRFDPESTAANVQAALVAHARWSENRLLAKLAAASTTVTYDQKLGATRDFLAMIDQTVAYYRSLHRLESTAQLRMILPAWVLAMFRVDLERALHNSNMDYFAVADAKITSWFDARGVAITWHLDGSTAAVAAAGGAPAIARQQYGPKLVANSPVPGFPDQVDALLFLDGEWLHLDGGTLDLGLVRDSALIGQNRYRMFSEEWVGVAFRGIESLHMVATVQPNGASSGTVAPTFTD